VVTFNVEEDGVGGGLVDILRRRASNYCWMRVMSTTVGAAAIDEEHYVNRRSELWFAGAEWLKTGAIPDNARLKRELVATSYGFDSRLRRKVESKDDIKRKTKRSPDVADSFLLSLVSAPVGDEVFYPDPSNWNWWHGTPEGGF
jgi:hypothetical protein